MTSWTYVVHLREGDTAPITEVSGVFVGTYLQAWSHISAIAAQHNSRIVTHELSERPTKGDVVRTTQPEVVVPKALPAPATPKEEPIPEPELPDGCEWSDEVLDLTTQEYKHHAYSKKGKRGSKRSTHRFH